MRVASFSFDEAGRLNVEKVPNSTHVIECDTVIFSVGQRAGLAFIPDDAGVGLTGRKLIAVNPNTLAATREGVFAAGDSVSGTAFVIEAVNSGHTAARSIMRYLAGRASRTAASSRSARREVDRAMRSTRAWRAARSNANRASPCPNCRSRSASTTSSRSKGATTINRRSRKPPAAWPAASARSA